jgi:CBS domain-containing protein
MGTGARVRDLMTRQVATLGRNDKLAIADEIMRQERIRHLVVLDDDGQVVGVLSQRDMFRSALARVLGYGEYGQDKLLNQLLVKEVMTTDVASVEPETSVEAAAELMIGRKIGCLPVVAAGRLVGILTEADFVKAYAELG